ncbi:MAG: CpaD family pilus assembly protein [Proteobacteria bacterium]|nr:CpaD family pilus assembly protein [Pseudomonadota bacterium]
MRPSLLLLLAGSALLGACATAPAPGTGPVNPLARTPLEQYPATFAQGVDEILLAPSGALSASQAAALGELVMRWREDGEAGPITVSAAASGPAHDTAAAAAQALVSFGVPTAAVQVADVPPAGPAAEPVRVGFARLEAVVADCSTRWSNLTATRNNGVHAGFGCAVSSNFAAQVANPRDLIQPRGGAPADGERRADVMSKYRQGQATASQRSQDERGTVSNSVQ